MTNWINNFLGVNLTPMVSFVLLFAAIIIGVLLLIWIARRLMGGTFVSGGRGRQLRLAVMDATAVDSRRRLVLVRRDDVEHLILIGGPTDVVVEQNIRIDGPRETRNTQISAEPTAPTRPIEAPRLPEAPRLEPARLPEHARPAPQHSAPITPLQHRPPPAPVPPAAPYLPPRPATPPVLPVQQQARPAPMAPSVTAATPPRPVAPAPRIEPVSAAMALRPDPVMTAPIAAPTAPPVFSNPANMTIPVNVAKPAETPKPFEQDMDDTLLADISDSLSFDDDEISPDVSLEKEMESLLNNLDTQKDRIS